MTFSLSSPSSDLKVSSKAKNYNFSKFAIFKWLNRANQELSFKKNSRKKCFFCADLWSAKVFSMLIILIDRWQVLSYLIRMSLLNQANHAIWQKSWSTRIVLTVFPWIWKWMPPKKKKSLSVFVHDSKTKEKSTKPTTNDKIDKSFRQRVVFEISRER